MTIGIGGSTVQVELEKLQDMTQTLAPILLEEFNQRIVKAQQLMKQNGIDAVYLNAGTNLYYFTGTQWYASERMVAALLMAEGELVYIAPAFELGTLDDYMLVKGRVETWHEDESPYELCHNVLEELGISNGTLAIDESAAFFFYDGLKQTCPGMSFVNSKPVTSGCRMQKSATELTVLQCAKDMTIEVHKAVARILRLGITTQEVETFINDAHKAVGAASGSYFCIVLFGGDSAYPHGVKTPKRLEQNDIVLIDTGCELHGYHSDITRTYVFGTASERQRQIWQLEKDAQLAAFEAAQIGQTCANVDKAARDIIAAAGFGPEYQLPGLPHRTGHGVGLDIHEWPYLVASDHTLLASGMCFSNEPMLCVPNEFGVRLEDHFYMTESGPKWFTEPSYSIDDPFGYEK